MGASMVVISVATAVLGLGIFWLFRKRVNCPP